MTNEKPILLFDGVCNLCNGTVNFIVKKDSKKQFRFVALQWATGKKIVDRFNLSANVDSVILVFKSRAFTESDAVIEIARLLPYPWKLALCIQIIPKRWRDRLYQWIAKNRYRWFGKKEHCRIPTPEEKEYLQMNETN